MTTNYLIITCIFLLHLTHSGKVSYSQQQNILALHNAERSDVRNGKARGKNGLLPSAKTMPTLRWNSNLASMAGAYADTCGRHKANNGYMCTHSTGWSGITSLKQRYGFRSVAENIGCPGRKGASSLPDGLVTHWVNAFIAESKDYAYGDRFNSKNGHYFRVIQASVTEIGCGTAKCTNGWWMVCHYNPSSKASDGISPYDKAGSGGSSYGGGSNSGYGGSNSGYGGSSSGGSSSSGSCVTISYLRSDLNGNWVKGGTKNGKTYYKKNGKYLFSSSYDGRYVINTQLQDPSNWSKYGYCIYPSKGVNCGGKWSIDGKTDTNAQIRSCGGFEKDELECIGHYADTLHFYETASEDPSHVFTLDPDEGCLNSEPVYKYIADEAQHVLYSDENGYKWTLDSIYNISGYEMVQQTLVCGEDNLYDCIKGHWFMQSPYTNVSGSSHNVTVNGSVVTVGSVENDLFTYDVVYDAQIKPYGSAASNAGSAVGEVIVPAVIILVALVIVGLALYAFHRYQSNKNVMKQLEMVEDFEEEEAEEEEGEEEQEIVVPMTTN
eukprot:25452_1